MVYTNLILWFACKVKLNNSSLLLKRGVATVVLLKNCGRFQLLISVEQTVFVILFAFVQGF